MKQNNVFTLKMLEEKESDLRLFVQFLLEYVKEGDDQTFDEEIFKIQNEYYVDNYFIVKNSEKIGIVKTSNNLFYSLGLPDNMKNSDLAEIVNLVEENLVVWHLSRILTTLNIQYLAVIRKLGYKIEYSRIKMILELDKATNLTNSNFEFIRTYKNKDYKAIIDVAADAYRDGIDEKVGIFSSSFAESAIRSIFDEEYGEFRPDLSAILVTSGTDYIEGISLTTITGEIPFIILVGVRRLEQGKGYGHALLSWVIKKSRERGYKKIKLWVTEGNNNAIKLYNSFGFKEVTKSFTATKQIIL